SANRTVTGEQSKKTMKKQIIERGGSIVEEINRIPLDTDALLLSDEYTLSSTYMMAMSRGMPCLSHMWLVEC
ncbi:hypothetical protein PENTCL1PPCAC_24056, partial [Pristionchus entomophagus]